ncbi:alpha/beta hydrolase [Candidatus Woesearchaeota archaeon]|nr:alpha/beta hydrolase [Candidatus Woesearchaeota archaeon]
MKISENEIVVVFIIVLLVSGSGYLFFIANKPYCGDGICQENEVELCFADCDWCGDGICQEDEGGICSLDCDWCGDYFCQAEESCSACAKDCGSCEADSYCGDLICNPGECGLGCDKDCGLVDCQDGLCESELGENCVTAPNDCRCGVNGRCNTKTRRCEIITCGNGRCDANENPMNCPADCKEEYIPQESVDPNTDLPIILIHGHSAKENEDVDYSNINHFLEFQNKLEKDGLYINKGILLPSAREESVGAGLWGKLNKPVCVRTTYYLGVYDDRGSIIGVEDEKDISAYSDRIKKTIDTLKHYTGKNKVIIIAHSMGGLVSREYIRKYGSGSVEVLVTIGTPNHGIIGGENIIAPAVGCSFSHPGLECYDMVEGSPFLTRLNSGDETPGRTRYLTITGKAKKGMIHVAGVVPYYPCGKTELYHDDVVCSTSVPLQGAKNLAYTGERFKHTYMLYPLTTPEVYDRIIEFIAG